MVSGWFQFLFPYGNSRHQPPGTHNSAGGLGPRMTGSEGKSIGNPSAASRSPVVRQTRNVRFRTDLSTKMCRSGTAHTAQRWALERQSGERTMKTILLTAAAALLLTSISPVSSFAQQNDENGYQQSRGDGYQPSRDEGYGMRHGGDRYGRMDYGSDRWRDMMNRMSRRGGARFQFSRGNAYIDIRCPRNDSLQDCVEAASRLIDKVHSLAAIPEDRRSPPPAPESRPDRSPPANQ